MSLGLKQHTPSSEAPEHSNGRNPVGGAAASEIERQGAHVVEMQRRRLLLAMGEVVAEEGLDGASVWRVCKRAGVSRRTFYDLFEDCEACFLAAFEQAIELVRDCVLPAYESASGWSTRIRAGLTELLKLFDSAPGVARLCVVETLRVGPAVTECRKRVLDAIVEAIGEGRTETKQGSSLSNVATQGVVGGVLSVIYGRLLEDGDPLLVELVNPLMAMIVNPYLGAAAARRELDRPPPETTGPAVLGSKDPFKGLSIRFTYRTARVLATIAARPGASNRLIAGTSGIVDEGQMSRLLVRLQNSGLIENSGSGQPRGEPNAWALTERGEAVRLALGVMPD
jgi:AcrR family transcriptional regulator